MHRDGTHGHEYHYGTYVYSEARDTESDDSVGIVVGYDTDYSYGDRYHVRFPDGYQGTYPGYALASVDTYPTR